MTSMSKWRVLAIIATDKHENKGGNINRDASPITSDVPAEDSMRLECPPFWKRNSHVFLTLGLMDRRQPDTNQLNLGDFHVVSPIYPPSKRAPNKLAVHPNWQYWRL